MSKSASKMKKGKKIEEEHIVYGEKGEIAGVYHIDTSKLEGKDLWQDIDNVIREYVRLHPNYMRLFFYENEQEKLQQNNKFASNRGKDFRVALSLPPALMFKLEQVEPELFTSKKLRHTFMRKYKGFCIAQTI